MSPDLLEVFDCFLIMAVSMVDGLVSGIVLSAQGSWDEVIDFQEVSIVKVESASWASPLLRLEQLCLLVVHKRVLPEPLRPVQEVSIIGAGVSAYLHVVLALRFRMVPDIDRYLVSRMILDMRPKPGLRANANAVLLACPLFALVRVACVSPSHELSKGVIITRAEDF